MGDDTAGQAMPIPASIEAAWGLHERPPRGPRPGLSLERIITAAIAVADADGLAAVSMARVAAELGSSAMSLYRYVASKDELLALMFDAEMGRPPVLPQGDWRTGLTTWTVGILDSYLQAPWSVRIPIPAPPITPNQIRWLEAALACLSGTSLTEQQKLSTVLVLSGLARGQASLAADLADAVRSAAGADPSAGYGAALARLAPREQFPAVHAAVLSGSLDDEETDFVHDQLAFGMTLILDGLERLITARDV